MCFFHVIKFEPNGIITHFRTICRVKFNMKWIFYIQNHIKITRNMLWCKSICFFPVLKSMRNTKKKDWICCRCCVGLCDWLRGPINRWNHRTNMPKSKKIANWNAKICKSGMLISPILNTKIGMQCMWSNFFPPFFQVFEAHGRFKEICIHIYLSLLTIYPCIIGRCIISLKIGKQKKSKNRIQ